MQLTSYFRMHEVTMLVTSISAINQKIRATIILPAMVLFIQSVNRSTPMLTLLWKPKQPVYLAIAKSQFQSTKHSKL